MPALGRGSSDTSDTFFYYRRTAVLLGASIMGERVTRVTNWQITQ
jgi:hypothetical protein